MKIEQVAIQLYTLRDQCKTAADYAATLKRCREIGYQAIQISGVGPIPVEELRSIAEGEGLAICATHEPGHEILNNPQAVVERLAALGCGHTAYPYPGGIDFRKCEDVKRLITGLDAAGAVLHAAGQTLSYHNHAIEFVHIDGRPALEVIYEQTNPANLQGEIDTYWVQAGGGDSVAWCQRLKGRLPLLHLKDFGVTYAENGQTVSGFTEIGSGNLDFKAIIAAAEASGCQWFIVEQDTCPGDPFESIAKSFNYIRDHLVS